MSRSIKMIGLVVAFGIGVIVAYGVEANCGVLPIPPAGCTNFCACDSNGLNCRVVTSC